MLANPAILARVRAGLLAFPGIPRLPVVPCVLRSVDWRVQVAAIVSMTAIVISIVFGLLNSKEPNINSLFPLVIALLVVPVVTGLVALFKSDENSRKLDDVSGKIEKIDHQTNGGLHDSVRGAVIDALNRILADNEEEARRNKG